MRADHSPALFLAFGLFHGVLFHGATVSAVFGRFRRRCSVSSVFGTLARRPFPLSLKLPRRCRARGVAFCVVFGAFLGRCCFRWEIFDRPFFVRFRAFLRVRRVAPFVRRSFPSVATGGGGYFLKSHRGRALPHLSPKKNFFEKWMKNT